jgi:hypothetical protein
MPNLITPSCGRRFVAQSTKKQWTTPRIRQFETAEKPWTFYDHKVSGVERENLKKPLERAKILQNSN